MADEHDPAATDVRRGSGFRGDAARWRRARLPIVEAIDRSGTFLDVGCANGLLMESMAVWAAEDGHAVEPSGLERSHQLAELARRRLPAWAGRIHVGDVLAWDPPHRETSCGRSWCTRRIRPRRSTGASASSSLAAAG